MKGTKQDKKGLKIDFGDLGMVDQLGVTAQGGVQWKFENYPFRFLM